MNKRNWFFLGLIVLISSTLSFFMLTRGHPWWDDFAAYVMQAKSLLAWNPAGFVHHNAFTIENSSYPPGPVAYPWGYPLLLAPVYAIFGLNPLALKMVGLVFYAVFLVAFYFLARTRLDETEALLLTSVLAVPPALLSANDLILSDIPFLAISTLSLVLAERFARASKSPDYRLGLALGAAIFMAVFLRTTGMLLLAPLTLSLLLADWPDWRAALKKAVPPFLTVGVLLGIQSLLLPGGQESYLSHFSMLTPARLLDNLVYYLWLPAWTFDQIPGGAALYPLLMVFVLISLWTHLKRDTALQAYSLLTVILFIIWPERQGLRFIYPVLPIFFISAFDGMKLASARLSTEWQRSAQKLIRGFWVLLLLVFLGFSTYLAAENMLNGRAISGPFDPYSNQVFSFIREKTSVESVIIFVRPRAMRLFTDRDSFMTERCADLLKGDYLVLHEKMGNIGQIDPEEIRACPLPRPLEPVFNNKRFTVYKISK